MDNAERRAALVTVRDTLALAILDASPRELPALTREFRATVKELGELPATKEANPLDDLARRRENRLADPDVFDPPGAGGVVGGRRSS